MISSLHQAAKVLEPGSNSQILCSWILTLLLLSKKSSVFIAITGFQLTGCLMRRADSFEKTLMLGGIWGQEEKGMTEDEMA